MDVIFVLAVAIFIEKSCSQTLSQSPTCYENGDILELKCTTADFTKAINFLLNGSNEGGCSVGCAPNIVQSGTVTTKTLSSFSSSTHSGNWTCSYGLSVSAVVIIAENPCSGGGGSTGLSWWEMFLIVVAVIALIIIAFIIFCCILNSRCKFGDVCKDSKLSFTFPPGNGSKAKITPERKRGYKEDTSNKGRNENPTPKSKIVDKEVTPYQEAIINDKLNNGKSSIAASPPRSGANQPLYPLIKGEGGNGNGEDLTK